MCGIVGVVTKEKNALECLIDGLSHLEYRGYDSAGIAYIKNDEIRIVRSVGRISNLKDKIQFEPITIGIGHTRWATHGKPTEKNAHPHRVNKITLVHNGIIENFLQLKNELIEKGYTFNSDTDTEVASAYIDYIYNKEKNMVKTLSIISDIFIGSYAFGIINEDEKDKIYALRNDSPLIIGIGDESHYIASDVPAILKYTKKYIDLDNNEIVCISSEDIKIYNKQCSMLEKEIKEFEEGEFSAEKNGYETYMLKEIHEEAEVIKKTAQSIIDKDEDKILDMSKYTQIDIVACGSAYHAGLAGKYFIEKYMKIPVNVDLASEYQYKDNLYQGSPLVIAISQSGETADTKKCVIKANEKGIDTLGLVNVIGSSIARISKYVIYTKAGTEVAVATTKAYLSQIMTLFLIAYKNSKIEVKEDFMEDLKKLPTYIENIIDRDYKDIAKELFEKNDIYFIGRGVDYTLCLEGSLKLKEISYIHSEAYAAGELKHGTISLIDEGTPVIVIATDENLILKTLSNAKEVAARGAKVIIVTNNKEIDTSEFYKTIYVPKAHELLQSVLTIVPLQLIAYEVAKLRGCDIDKPKNLAKSVTVE